MYQYNILQWMLCFYIYCFLGWCWESLYVSARRHHWVNRGFMRGPFLPIYGSGAVMMLVVSRPFYQYMGLTFLAGMVGATLLELVTGILMEMIFKVRYWDYSTKPFNYKGYICLSSTLMWGVFTVLMTRVLHKPIDHFLRWLPVRALIPGTLALTVWIVIDFVQSFVGAINLRNALDRIDKAKKEIEILQRRMEAAIAFSELPSKEGAGMGISAAAEKLGELKDKVLSNDVLGGLKEKIPSSEMLDGLKEKMPSSEMLDGLKERMPSPEMLEELKQRMSESVERLRLLDESKRKRHRRRLLGNPTMVSKRYRDALAELRQFIEDNAGRKR